MLMYAYVCLRMLYVCCTTSKQAERMLTYAYLRIPTYACECFTYALLLRTDALLMLYCFEAGRALRALALLERVQAADVPPHAYVC